MLNIGYSKKQPLLQAYGGKDREPRNDEDHGQTPDESSFNPKWLYNKTILNNRINLASETSCPTNGECYINHSTQLS